MCKVIFLFAVSKNGVIGKNGDMPWHYPEDLQRFKRLTTGYPIVMGRKTWESLPVKPLPNRENIVLTKNQEFSDSRCHIYDSLKPAIFDFRAEKLFVIGGAEIFRYYMNFADELDICYISKEYDGDVYLPDFKIENWKIAEMMAGDHPDLQYVRYIRK